MSILKWILNALKGLFEVNINIYVKMVVALFGKVEQPTYYMLFPPDKETAIQMAKEFLPDKNTIDPSSEHPADAILENSHDN